MTDQPEPKDERCSLCNRRIAEVPFSYGRRGVWMHVEAPTPYDHPATPAPQPEQERREPQMDEAQARILAGPRCYALLGEMMPDGVTPKYCGRAERWRGHPADHLFIPPPAQQPPASGGPLPEAYSVWPNSSHPRHTYDDLNEFAGRLVPGDEPRCVFIDRHGYGCAYREGDTEAHNKPVDHEWCYSTDCHPFQQAVPSAEPREDANDDTPLDWLDNLVYAGRGPVLLATTENGDIGIFFRDDEVALGCGDTVEHAARQAQHREEIAREKETTNAHRKPGSAPVVSYEEVPPVTRSAGGSFDNEMESTPRPPASSMPEAAEPEGARKHITNCTEYHAHRRETCPCSLRERVAALAHEMWSGWMRYMLPRCGAGLRVISRPDFARWSRQMSTPYADLPEDEKESDRKEADRILALILGDARKAQEVK